jgi:hypothetical protein
VKYNFARAKLWRVVFPAFEMGAIGNSPQSDYWLTSTTDGRAIPNPIRYRTSAALSALLRLRISIVFSAMQPASHQ